MRHCRSPGRKPGGRIMRERMQYVGDQQFLMLLLVMQPDLEDRKNALCVRRRNLRD